MFYFSLGGHLWQSTVDALTLALLLTERYFHIVQRQSIGDAFVSQHGGSRELGLSFFSGQNANYCVHQIIGQLPSSQGRTQIMFAL